MKQLFQAPATIRLPKMRADNTLTFTVDCPELDPAELTALFKLNSKQGWFLFKENEIQPEDVPTEQAPEMEEKSQSKRLRNTLFVYWKTRHDAGLMKSDFEDFKRKWFEKKIQEIKDNIDL